ncbi:unnamed protein product [Amoebophrya sp. A120]|nr:unnamed protein product [Amoebophrya sp. A120]|eukprot:GSA120T00007195001.1
MAQLHFEEEAGLFTQDPSQPPSMVKDLEFIQQHHHKFYSEMTIEYADDDQAFFFLASKRQPNRRLKLSLAADTAYTVLEDSTEDAAQSLISQQFESFEQVMSALDKGGFGDLLCNLVVDKLGELGELATEEPDEFEQNDAKFYNRPGQIDEEAHGVIGGGGIFGGVIDDVDPMAD